VHLFDDAAPLDGEAQPLDDRRQAVIMDGVDRLPPGHIKMARIGLVEILPRRRHRRDAVRQQCLTTAWIKD
jgi:hypothetical protein